MRLVRELEEVWSFLEDGLPGLETELSLEEEETASKKRKRDKTREEEIMRLEEELEVVRKCMEELTVEIELCKPGKVVEKDSLMIPDVVVESSPVEDKIKKFEKNDELISDLKIQNAIKPAKSPVRILINKYENMNGLSGVNVSCAKPNSQGTQGKSKVNGLPRLSGSKLGVGVRKGRMNPSMMRDTIRKKVWGVLLRSI